MAPRSDARAGSGADVTRQNDRALRRVRTNCRFNGTDPVPRELFPAPDERRDGRSPGLRVIAFSPPSRPFEKDQWHLAVCSSLTVAGTAPVWESMAFPPGVPSWPSRAPSGRGYQMLRCERSSVFAPGAGGARLGEPGTSAAPAEFSAKILVCNRAEAQGLMGAQGALRKPRPCASAGWHGRRDPPSQRVYDPCGAVSCRFWRNHVVFRDLRWSRACPFAHAQAPLGTLIGPCADRRGAALRRKVRWTGPRRADIPQFGTDSAFGLRRVDQHLCAIWFSQGGEGAGEQAARQDRAGQHGALTARPDRTAWHVRAQ
jgi:hypothetical protein